MSWGQPILDAVIPAAQAHEKWFVASDTVTYPVPAFYQSFNVYTVSALLVLFLFSVAGLYLNKRYDASAFGRRAEAAIRKYRDYAAGVLAFTTGLTLVWMAAHNQHIAPNYFFPDTMFGEILRWVQGAVGILLMIGLFTPVAAIGLLFVYLLTFVLHAPIEPLDYVNYVGVAVFLLVFARGRYSLDWFLGKPILSTPEQRKWAYRFLRVCTGFALFWLALLKWRRPDLHFSLMDQYASWNPYVLLNWVGIHPSREMYVFLLACVEGAVGIFEMIGALTRIVSLMLVPIMLGSMLFLGPGELIGHLPILGTLFVLFIYGDEYYKNRLPDRYAEHPITKALAGKK